MCNCNNCEKTYVEGYIEGLNLDKSSDLTKAIVEMAKFESSLSCKISKLEKKLDILQANLCNLEACLDSECCCCCDEASCCCPDDCSCKVKCKNCGTMNHVSGPCACTNDCSCNSSNNSSCCCK